MSTVKLKIDFHNGMIDVEGSEQFVAGIYKDFKDKLQPIAAGSGSHTPPAPPPNPKLTSKEKGSKPPAPAGATKARGRGNRNPAIVKNLDLSGQGKVERLKDFYAKFEPKTNMERNLIFVYYLKQKLELETVTTDHVFTCYRDISGIKAPEALRQSLIDTASRRGWLDTEDSDDIQITIPGVNYLEHDMAKKTTE